ncbi:hypothetical protein Y032_0025g1117 [Ancylostoma ceylanicum]|uniref:Uncharacterized protein n=1 Tax=Ancylostoma ceylanicum TaxID=53326 RepID=A0A016UVM4_9BILA|nr:hypothetical protein Y032_0025g1117 [Ancylostoma ceylanicum]
MWLSNGVNFENIGHRRTRHLRNESTQCSYVHLKTLSPRWAGSLVVRRHKKNIRKNTLEANSLSVQKFVVVISNNPEEAP